MHAFATHFRSCLLLGVFLGLVASCGRDSKTSHPPTEASVEVPSRKQISNLSSGLEGLIWGSLRDPTPGTQFQTLSLNEFLASYSDLLILASGCVGGRAAFENDCLLAVQKNGGSPYLFSTRLERAADFDEVAERVRRLNRGGEAIRAFIGDEKNGFTLITQTPEFGPQAPRFEFAWVRTSDKNALVQRLATQAKNGWLLSAVLKIPGREEYGAVISRSMDQAVVSYEFKSLETSAVVDSAARELGAQGFVVRGITRSKPDAELPASALLLAYRLSSVASIRMSTFSADYRAGSRQEWSIAEHASVRGKIMVSAFDLERCVISRDGLKNCWARALGYRY